MGRRRKTHTEFVAEVEALVGGEYTVLCEYKDSKTKVKMKHNKCSHIFEIAPNNFISKNSRCPNCFGSEAQRKTIETFKQEIFSLVGREYTVLGEYKNCKTKVKMRHNKCNHEYQLLPSKFISNGSRCPNCLESEARRKSTESFRHEVFSLVGKEYTVLGEYINSLSNIKIKHNKCNCIYEVRPSNFIHSGSRCPNCNESKGERHVAELLTKIHEIFTKQYKFDNCRNIKKLPFDFAIFNSDNSIKCLIEYDGEQHFHAVDIFGGEEGFKVRKKCDAIKTQYCADHNIPLIRIPYWEFDNINEILTKEIAKLDITKGSAYALKT